jgi:hypothetical protein
MRTRQADRIPHAAPYTASPSGKIRAAVSPNGRRAPRDGAARRALRLSSQIAPVGNRVPRARKQWRPQSMRRSTGASLRPRRASTKPPATAPAPKAMHNTSMAAPRDTPPQKGQPSASALAGMICERDREPWLGAVKLKTRAWTFSPGRKQSRSTEHDFNVGLLNVESAINQELLKVIWGACDPSRFRNFEKASC